MAHTQLDPQQLTEAAGKLDRLASDLESGLAQQAPALSVKPAGADEVSTRAADTFNAAAGDFHTNAAAGVHELRKIAEVLRQQSGAFTEQEEINRNALRA